jgi:hypothetical protein
MDRLKINQFSAGKNHDWSHPSQLAIAQDSLKIEAGDPRLPLNDEKLESSPS